MLDTVRQGYLAVSDKLMGSVEEIEGLDEAARSRNCGWRRRGFVDAMSPANFAADQPRGDASGRSTPSGENLLSGLKQHDRRHLARAR